MCVMFYHLYTSYIMCVLFLMFYYDKEAKSRRSLFLIIFSDIFVTGIARIQSHFGNNLGNGYTER